MFGIFNKKNKTEVVVRMAPSPTGNLNIATSRATLFNFLFARKYNGKFILRIEDTDKERSKKEFEENILEGLSWLGLHHDEIFRQSERVNIHKDYLVKMITDGKAYVSKETPKEEGDRDSVIRFKNPNKVVVFQDEVRGEVKFDTTELGDFIIAKSETEPLYHLAVVVDDFEMGVTHVIRGEDHISNTPRQILIQEAINAPRPVYAHLPLVLGPDRSKLSKRHGATALSAYKDEGYLPEAIINQLALLGWNPGTEQELFTLDELITSFGLDKITKSGAIFNKEKLDWFNKEYLRKMNEDEFNHVVAEKLSGLNFGGEVISKLRPMILDRISKFSDIDKMLKDGELDYFEKLPDYDVDKLSWKENPSEITLKHLQKVSDIINNLSESTWTAGIIKKVIWPYAEKEGRGDVLWPLRYALSGRDRSPDPFELTEILGKEESLKRINNAISKINK